MDVALSWAKAWSKYTKEILNYVEKRTSLGKFTRFFFNGSRR